MYDTDVQIKVKRLVVIIKGEVMQKKLGMYSIIISSALIFSQNLLAERLGNYVFPPLEEMDSTIEQKYVPDTYMSYTSHHNNSSFFQQSEYVFPEPEKPVNLKSSYPTKKVNHKRESLNIESSYERNNYSKFSDLTNEDYYYSADEYMTASDDIRYPSSRYDLDSKYYVSPSMKKDYKYPSSISKYRNHKQLDNDFFDMSSWNPMSSRFGTGKFPMFPGMSNSSFFSRSGLMPGFF